MAETDATTTAQDLLAMVNAGYLVGVRGSFDPIANARGFQITATSAGRRTIKVWARVLSVAMRVAREDVES